MYSLSSTYDTNDVAAEYMDREGVRASPFVEGGDKTIRRGMHRRRVAVDAVINQYDYLAMKSSRCSKPKKNLAFSERGTNHGLSIHRNSII